MNWVPRGYILFSIKKYRERAYIEKLLEKKSFTRFTRGGFRVPGPGPRAQMLLTPRAGMWYIGGVKGAINAESQKPPCSAPGAHPFMDPCIPSWGLLSVGGPSDGGLRVPSGGILHTQPVGHPRGAHPSDPLWGPRASRTRPCYRPRTGDLQGHLPHGAWGRHHSHNGMGAEALYHW